MVRRGCPDLGEGALMVRRGCPDGQARVPRLMVRLPTMQPSLLPSVSDLCPQSEENVCSKPPLHLSAGPRHLRLAQPVRHVPSQERAEQDQDEHQVPEDQDDQDDQDGAEDHGQAADGGATRCPLPRRRLRPRHHRRRRCVRTLGVPAPGPRAPYALRLHTAVCVVPLSAVFRTRLAVPRRTPTCTPLRSTPCGLCMSALITPSSNWHTGSRSCRRHGHQYHQPEYPVRAKLDRPSSPV